jgi:hypothetical protein
MKALNSLCFLGLTLFFASCGRSAVGLGGPPDSLTSIQVNSTDLARTQQVTRQVFAGEGFQEIDSSASTISFAKQGDRAARLAWGGWGDEVMIKPEVSIRRAGSGIRLDCDLFIATVSEAFGETSRRKPWRAGRSAYHGVLKEIKKRVEGR